MFTSVMERVARRPRAARHAWPQPTFTRSTGHGASGLLWLLAVLAYGGIAPVDLHGQELRGSLFVETRVFPSSPAFGDQDDATFSPSLGLAPEFLWENADGRVQVRIEPFLRWDAHDDERTHFDMREASVTYLADRWTLFAGMGRVFWGKTESVHLVDIVNQTDAVEDIDTEDKLGQPMISFTLERDWGAIDFMWLPFFRERTFPGEDARLRGPVPVTDAVFDSDPDFPRPDFAVRWTYYTGGLDLGVSAFRGLSREPRFSQLVPTELVPVYDDIDQLSVDAQWTAGATLWKLEAMTRGGHGDRFAAAVFGVEHTLFNLGPGPADLGLLAEVMYDGRSETAPFTPFDNDAFFGARWAFNDPNDTSILGGPVIDFETGEVFGFIEAERRIGNRWVAELEARILANTDATGPIHGLRRDDFIALRISRYF